MHGVEPPGRKNLPAPSGLIFQKCNERYNEAIFCSPAQI